MSINRRTLWLIRHAKADNPCWARPTPNASSPRVAGGRAAPDARLALTPNAPQWVWVSPAIRTRQTAEPLADCGRVGVICDPSLYLADALTLLDCLHGTPG